MPVWHTLFIALHAASATLALVAGLVALRGGRLFALYRWAMLGMALALAAAIAAGWPGYTGALRVVYVGLAVLAAAMVARANLAARMLPARTGGPTWRYLDHVGFTLIALADGFVVVAVLDAGAPGWATAAAGVAVAVGGHLGLRARQLRLARPGSHPSAR
jgi:hypothetical protein